MCEESHLRYCALASLADCATVALSKTIKLVSYYEVSA